METPIPETLPDPMALTVTMKVGAWHVSGIQGRGTYGIVYRAVSQERKQPEPAALKLAVYPGDPRFEHEAELLSRIRHPSVPRLLDSGMWQSPEGAIHPFIVMEWVEGEPLYTWAARRNPSSRQVLALLAQAAGALQAIHEVSAVHRDVKGDNMMVRPADGRLFLTDLGGGYFTGAPRLTPPHVLLGTPEYHSPELWESTRRTKHKEISVAMARPADDVFALGVTAYRLVTDAYPPMPLPDMKAGECWRPGGPGAPPPRQLNPRVDAQLNALILRMLSANPEARGSALELAEAKKRGVAHAPASSDEPLFEWETLRPSQWTDEERSEARFLGGNRPRLRDRERVLVEAAAGRKDKAIALLRPAVERSDDPEYMAQLAGLLRDTGKQAEAEPLLAKARAGFEHWTARHPLAFSDHAVRFWLGLGADPRKALALAESNLLARRSVDALELYSQAVKAADAKAQGCKTVQGLLASAEPLAPALAERARTVAADCR